MKPSWNVRTSDEQDNGVVQEKGITFVQGNRFDPNGIIDLSWKMGEHGNRRYGWINIAQRNDGTMTVQAEVTSSREGSERDRLMQTEVKNVPLDKLRAALDDVFSAAKSYDPSSDARANWVAKSERTNKTDRTKCPDDRFISGFSH